VRLLWEKIVPVVKKITIRKIFFKLNFIRYSKVQKSPAK
jgi:hypothetical protein